MTQPRTHDVPVLPHGGDGAAAAATELAHLHGEVAEARAELHRLRRDVVEAENHLDSQVAAQLLEANEHLVLAALDAQSSAETSARALDRASRSAELDPLTELPNRVLLLDRLVQAIANARRRKVRMAVLFLDLNNFKHINDTLGHAVGDEVLKLASRCLASAVREADTVSRHGGDEFLILLAEVSRPADAARVAEKVAAALGAPSRFGDHVLRLTASIGISIFPDDGDDADTLIDRADAAMYRAKRRGKGGFVFHAHGIDGESAETLPLPSLQHPVTHYELALAENELRNSELREANEQLVLAALTAQELQAAAEEAHQRQTRFLAVLAHELRNPLAPIRTAAALLGRLKGDETMLPQLQGVIERQVVRMSRLVSDLLDVSRVNTGKLRLERGVVEMAHVIDAAVATCRPAIDTRLQRFTVHVPARALQVDGDPMRLEQVVSNLLDNASKYTPDSGQVDLAVEVVAGAIVISLTDNGIGITAEALPHIFEPFVQDSHAIGFNGVGLGIGLTVVRELVEAHGGSVVASSPGTGLGSSFVVTLPLLAASDGAEDPASRL